METGRLTAAAAVYLCRGDAEAERTSAGPAGLAQEELGQAGQLGGGRQAAHPQGHHLQGEGGAPLEKSKTVPKLLYFSFSVFF